MQMHSPKEIIDINMSSAVNKANLRLRKMIVLGILAGMFIALGGVSSQTASHAITNVSLAKIAAGTVFPIGLLMIVLVGGELFTGNCLMIMATLDKQIRVRRFLRNLFVVFFSNVIGALIIALLVFFSGNLDLSGGALGGYTISVAVEKVSHSTIRGITSGFLCNLFVCMAVLKGAAAKEVAGKIQATWFPIFAFVICGFEHIVANMYFIPIGLLAKTNPLYVQQAETVYNVTAEKLATLTVPNILNNFIPVTIGNVLGGLFIGLMLYFVNVHADKITE
ncbi:MAG: formate/nitrite transporter family protein [Lachnospiraceae bacterium]|nr:formate/nitrite transporter family protein [Lachnospiraceae bacterium]